MSWVRDPKAYPDLNRPSFSSTVHGRTDQVGAALSAVFKTRDTQYTLRRIRCAAYHLTPPTLPTSSKASLDQSSSSDTRTEAPSSQTRLQEIPTSRPSST